VPVAGAPLASGNQNGVTSEGESGVCGNALPQWMQNRPLPGSGLPQWGQIILSAP